MLHRVFRLQAVLERITNQTALALNLISSQQRHLSAAIYQNRLALDYLLAEEGGVCRKFNSSQYCVGIDDHGKAIKNITNNTRKLAHVPAQRWTPHFKANWWDNLFGGNWWNKILFFGLCALTGIIFLPCVLPCLIQLITRIVQSSLEKLTEEKIMMLKTDKQKETPDTDKETYKKYRRLRKLYRIMKSTMVDDG